MAITIQNESKKIALTAAQLSSLSAAYKDFMAKQTVNVAPVNVGTNVDAVEQIVNTNTPTLQEDVLITDAPVVNQAPVQSESANMFDTVPVVNDSAVKPEGLEASQTIVAPPVTEEVRIDTVQDAMQESKNDVTVVAIDMEELKKQLLDEYYDLQVHVQEYGVKLEETLEKMNKLTDNKVIEKQEEVSVAPASSYVVSAPVTQSVASPTVETVASANQSVNHVEQTFPENVNIFDQGVNIFDQAPQTPSNGGQIKM